MQGRSRSPFRGALLLAAVTIVTSTCVPQARSAPAEGDLLVTEQGPGGAPGAVVQVDPVTGVQTTLPIGGAALVRPIGIDRTPDGDLVVADNADNSSTSATIYRVDAAGQATIVAAGGALSQLTGLAVDGDGRLFAARHGPPAILGVDLATGVVTVVASGGFLRTPWDLAVEADGRLVVADIDGGLLRVDPATGHQTLIRSASAALFNFRGVAVAADGGLFVSGEASTPGGPAGTVARVDPSTSVPTAITQGQHLRFPFAVRVEPDGRLAVVEEGSVVTLPAVVRVDPATGAQELLSAAGDLAAPVGLTIVREVDIVVVVDVRPDSSVNPVRPGSGGVLPVAVLGGHELAATLVDPATVRFGATGVEAAAERFTSEDVDGDGEIDLLLHFRIRLTGLDCAADRATLTGRTFDGLRIVGSDAIHAVGCR